MGVQIVSSDKIYDKHEERFAYQQAKILNTYILEFRHYYQGLFVEKVIELDENTLKALPAFALLPINEKFSEDNLFKIEIKTVSDNARNPNNIADKYELLAMERFRQNPKLEEIFEKIDENGKGFYQYYSPLAVKESCLACHSSKEKAPKFISEKYDSGYGYKLGDLRGVISVKIPKEHISEFFGIQKSFSLFFNFAIFGIFLLLLLGAYKILALFNKELQNEVAEKTKELNSRLNDLSLYKKTLDDSSIVSITDRRGIIKYVNENFTKASGYEFDEAIGKSHSIVRHPDTPNEIFRDLWSTILAKKTWKGIIKNRKKDGGYYVLDMTIEPIVDENGELIEFIAARHEITEIYDKQQEIERLALYDTLSALGNRTKLVRDLQTKKAPAMAIFDIDRFTDINDFYGHDIGDIILRELGELLRLHLDKRGEVYRYSGDRFALVAEDMERNTFVELVKEIQEKIKHTDFGVEDKKISLQVSVALSFEESDTLVQTVDLALSEIKKRKTGFLVYEKSLGLEKEIEKNLEWDTKLKKALQEDRIIPFFQPIYNNKSGRIEKYEALVRMIDINGDVISPFKFLGVAKKTKQYIAITKEVINKTFEMFDGKGYEFSINLTVEDILSDEVNSLLEEKIMKYGKGRLVFEIVESEGIENLDEVTHFIKKAKECDCKIAIDDFGTGYSNFEYLIKMSPDFIKIDGSMIRDIDKNIDNEEIVKTIIEFAKKRGLKTIAEFVSSKEVFEKVVELGIDYSQGYYIGEPKNGIDG